MPKQTRVEMPITLADFKDISLEGEAWERGLLNPKFEGETKLMQVKWDNETQTGVAIFILTEEDDD
jgi:hypothetical protein